MLRLRGAVVVEQAVVRAQPFIDLLQLLFHDSGQGLIERIGRFSGLEKDIGILCRTIYFSVMRVQGAPAEADQGFRQLVISLRAVCPGLTEQHFF